MQHWQSDRESGAILLCCPNREVISAGISVCLACRQTHVPVFPVHNVSSSQTIIQHPSPMQTQTQPPNLGLAAVRVSSAPATAADCHQSLAAPTDWTLSAVPANPVTTQHAIRATNQRTSSLPTGFVPLQPVSTTEVCKNQR